MENKYKVEVKQIDTFVVDIEAETEEQAGALARNTWDDIVRNGMEHYHQQGDTEVEIGNVYNVTGTDDAL